MRSFGIAVVLLSFCALFPPGTAEGQTVRCESVTDNAKRLACFDRETSERERAGKHEKACTILAGYAMAPGARDIRKTSDFSELVQLCNAHPKKPVCEETAEFLASLSHVPKNILACRGGR